MNYSIKILIKIAEMIFPRLMEEMTPVIREELKKTLLTLYEKAERTQNPFDDLVVIMLIEILGFDKEIEGK